jgi:threonine/homoserine/homoserine lactone efflux protein
MRQHMPPTLRVNGAKATALLVGAECNNAGVIAFSAVASFALVAGLMTIIPGLDTVLVVRTALAQGRRSGFAVALGINTGVLIWGAAAAVGVSALLVASHLAYDVVRIAGAVYLIWLGSSMLWHTWGRRATRGTEAASREQESSVAAGSVLRSWARGVTTNLLNPKIGAFYVAILPQFIPAHSPHLLMGLTLAGVHDAEGIIWFTMLISAAHLARRFLESERAQRIMDRVAGTVLIGFGVKLALSNG